jgi:hypothetical protein
MEFSERTDRQAAKRATVHELIALNDPDEVLAAGIMPRYVVDAVPAERDERVVLDIPDEICSARRAIALPNGNPSRRACRLASAIEPLSVG